jgi:hypothetical protein
LIFNFLLWANVEMNKRIPKFALIELERHDWSRYRDVRAFLEEPTVSSAYIPQAVRGLLQSHSADDIQHWYWQIENHAVVQGSTYQVAEHLITVLVAALNDLEGCAVRASVLELIFQMVAYNPASEEVNIGNTDLTERCRMRAREGTWEFYKILINGEVGESESARNILEVIETDPERLAAFVASNLKEMAA